MVVPILFKSIQAALDPNKIICGLQLIKQLGSFLPPSAILENVECVE